MVFPKPFPEVGTALLGADPDAIVNILEQNTDQYESPFVFLEKVVSPKMETIGEAFEEGKLFLPQLIVAGETMKKLLNALKGSGQSGERAESANPVLFFTVQNDIHDIGKNIVGMIMKGAGFNVIDLGVDVPAERFVEAVSEKKADILALSALLSTTMPSMRDTIGIVAKSGIRNRIKILVGGAPITSKFADEIGANGYAEDAPGAVTEAKRVLKLS